MAASVGRECSTLSGMFVGRVCLMGSGGWRNVYWGHSFFLFGTGDTPDSWVFVLLVPQEPPLIVSFVVSFVCEAVRRFPCFPCVFCPLLFRIFSLGFSSPLGSAGVGGRTAGRGLSRVGYLARDVAEDLLCFLFFLLLQLATRS